VGHKVDLNGARYIRAHILPLTAISRYRRATQLLPVRFDFEIFLSLGHYANLSPHALSVRDTLPGFHGTETGYIKSLLNNQSPVVLLIREVMRSEVS
jgi:hypothetical protein